MASTTISLDFKVQGEWFTNTVFGNVKKSKDVNIYGKIFATHNYYFAVFYPWIQNPKLVKL